MVSSDSQVKPFTRVCIQSYKNDKFLVAHEETGQIRGLYTCMQILKRSSTVLQIREAELSEGMGRNLCDDSNMKLDGWIIMDIKSVMNHREDCSLVGGFNMQVYDKSSYKGVCDGYLGETRLESECLPGDGLNFHYRQAKCIPDGLYMYPTQRSYCLANWEDGQFKFILLKHDRMNYLWVMRFPKDVQSNGKFTAFLMKDLYATTDNAVTTTNNYLSLTMSKQNPKTLDHLCYDDYEICSVLKNPCSYSEEIARTCAKTCGFCTDLSPTVCQFSIPINGSWVDANQADKSPSVQINTTSIEITGQETLHCVDWSDSKRESRATDEEPPTTVTPTNNKQLKEQMLISVSDNGCRPRFSCGKFTKLPSNVMFMQLTQTRLWPLVQNKEDPLGCRKFIYTSDKDVDTNPYRTRHETMFILDHINNSVQCDLSDFETFAVLFKDGVRCSGHVVQGGNKDTIQLSFPECSVQRLRHKFTCLEHSRYPPENDMLLVTKSHESPSKVHCWLFPKQPENTFYIIESEQCNSLMKRKIRKGRLRPIATFTRDPTRKIKVVTEETIVVPDEKSNIVKQGPVNNTLIIIEKVQPVHKIPKNKNNVLKSKPTKSSPFDATQVNEVVLSEVDDDDNNATNNKNYTVISDEVEEDGAEASPIVVFAIILTLIIFQIPLICQCKG